jgi:hypothetical protein
MYSPALAHAGKPTLLQKVLWTDPQQLGFPSRRQGIYVGTDEGLDESKEVVLEIGGLTLLATTSSALLVLVLVLVLLSSCLVQERSPIPI